MAFIELPCWIERTKSVFSFVGHCRITKHDDHFNLRGGGGGGGGGSPFFLYFPHFLF